MDARALARVRRSVRAFYKAHGRNHLPWRATSNPYHILVSEVMLQQTQVDRVLPYYRAFLKKFPTTKKLAQASLKEVLYVWAGLGYNRRAKFLHECAQRIELECGGVVPRENAALRALPGVGEYTAKAIRVFAYNEPEVLLETNVRAVVLHHCFPGVAAVSDAEVCACAGVLARGQNPREWHAALMDYGSHLKKTVPNPSRRGVGYRRQKPFKGSMREVRGAIIALLRSKAHTRAALGRALPRGMQVQCERALDALVREEMVQEKSGTFFL